MPNNLDTDLLKELFDTYRGIKKGGINTMIIYTYGDKTVLFEQGTIHENMGIVNTEHAKVKPKYADGI